MSETRCTTTVIEGKIIITWDRTGFKNHLAQLFLNWGRTEGVRVDHRTLMFFVDVGRTSLEQMLPRLNAFGYIPGRLVLSVRIQQALKAVQPNIVLLGDFSGTPMKTKVYGWAEDPAHPEAEIRSYQDFEIGENTPFGQLLAAGVGCVTR